jgi:sugar lactone lactonase YvrE
MTEAELVLDCRDEIGEGPVWDPVEQALWWLDINGRRLHRWHPESRRHTTVATPARVGSFALREAGGMVAAMEHAVGWLDPASGGFEPLAEPEAGRADHRFNDGRCDPRGRFFAGSMNLTLQAPTGILWRLDPRRRLAEVAGYATVANGLAWSPEGTRMYWADSPRARIWTFAYDLDEGIPYDRRLWAESDPDGPLGRPDGAAVDSLGGYWIARYRAGRVLRLTPDGRIDRVIRLPCGRVTMCAFGDSDLKTLYVTTARHNADPAELAREPLAGGLFACRVDVAGLPEPRFAG